MGIRIYNHNRALERLQTRCGGIAFKELIEVLHRIVLIRYAGKSEKTKDLEFLQTCMNHTLDHVLKFHYGWHPQVFTPGSTDDNLDFYKKWAEDLRVWMECELGNIARADADIRKLRTLFQQGFSDVGILIVPVSALANRIDRNVASFERVLKILRKDASNTFPLLLVGLELDENKVVDVTNWGYELGQLKGKKEGDPVVKTHLAKRIWRDYMLPSLPSDSMHQRHLDAVSRLGFNPGLRPPVFPGFTPVAEATPETLTLNEDGTTTIFVDTQKADRRHDEKRSENTAPIRRPKPRAAQMQLALSLVGPQSEAANTVSPPPSRPERADFPTAAPKRCEPTLCIPNHSANQPRDAEPAGLKDSLPASEISVSPGTPLASARRADSVARHYPEPRPVPKAADGPRLGPWLSRGAGASPFVHSFA
jgi:hypothetical protein